MNLFNKLKNITFKKKSSRVDYVAKHSQFDINDKETRDIVLAPSFYWIKRENIAVRSERDAMKFAKSVFDGVLSEELDKFKYLVIREPTKENMFFFIAYKPDDILKELLAIGIYEKNIKKIYMAQSEFQSIESPKYINNNRAIISIDGIISEIQITTNNINEKDFLNNYLKNSYRTKYGIKLKTSDLKNSNLLITSFIPFAISLYLATDIYKLYIDIQKLQIEMVKRKNIYKLPETSFQTESLLKKFENIETEQSELRDTLYWLSETKFEDLGKIYNFVIAKNGDFSFKFKIKQREKMNDIKMIIQKKSKKFNINENGDMLDVSFKK